MRPAAALARGLLDRTGWPIVAALGLLAAAVWMPPVPVQRDIHQVMATFDITQSMNVEDMELDGRPVSRLARAQATMRELLRRLPCGSKVGWSVFADYRVMPLLLPVEVCGHYEELLASLEGIDGRMRWADASNIGRGAYWTARTARSIGPDIRVLFFTDGHEAPPPRSAELPPLVDYTPGEIAGHLIGVGGDQPARIPRTDRAGRALGYWEAQDVVQPGAGRGHGHPEHLSALDEPHLKALARHVGFGYDRLHDAARLQALLDGQSTSRAAVATDLRWVPALLALALLAGRFLPAPHGLRALRRRPRSG